MRVIPSKHSMSGIKSNGLEYKMPQNASAVLNEYLPNKQQLSLTLINFIRQRQTALIHYFQQVYAIKRNPEMNIQNYEAVKFEFTQKEATLCSKIRMLNLAASQNQFLIESRELSTQQSFWQKLKASVKNSLEKSQSLGLLSQRLFGRYEQIIKAINQSQDSNYGIKEYPAVESMIRFKNVEAAIHCNRQIQQIKNNVGKLEFRKETDKQQDRAILTVLSPAVMNSHSLMIRAKQAIRKQTTSARSKPIINMKISSKRGVNHRITSSHRNKSQSVVTVSERAHDKYLRLIQGVMDVKLDSNLDKKRHDEKLAYQWLFLKNNHNAMMINRYISKKSRQPERQCSNTAPNQQRRLTLASSSQKKQTRGRTPSLGAILKTINRPKSPINEKMQRYSEQTEKNKTINTRSSSKMSPGSRTGSNSIIGIQSNKVLLNKLRSNVNNF